MELLNQKVFDGLIFDIPSEVLTTGHFNILLNISNTNDCKKWVKITAKYVSIELGYLEGMISPSNLGYTGIDILPNSFINAKIQFLSFKGPQKANDGDRLILDINEGKIASLILLRTEGKWYIQEYNNYEEVISKLKSKIEHFESIEEKLGIALQNFSIKIIDETSIKLYCEVISPNGIPPKDSFNIEVAVYDKENNIVGLTSNSKSGDEFMGFEVFGFGSINLGFPVDEIGKIRFYPTK